MSEELEANILDILNKIYTKLDEINETLWSLGLAEKDELTDHLED